MIRAQEEAVQLNELPFFSAWLTEPSRGPRHHLRILIRTASDPLRGRSHDYMTSQRTSPHPTNRGFELPDAARSRLEYNPALDGVRAIAVLAVLAFHCGAPWARGGSIGVDLFFVLSGYLITTLLVHEHHHGGIRVAAFYARRALRLTPTLLLVIVAYLALAPTLWPTDGKWVAAVAAATYVTDYALAYWNISWTIGHTWSLGVEEKFYLLWPLLLPLILRTRKPILWLLCGFVIATAWRYFVAVQWGWNHAYFAFDTRVSGILLGSVAALANLRICGISAAFACMALLFCLAAPFMPSLPSYLEVEAVTLGVTIAELSALSLICYLTQQRRHPIFSVAPMAYIGRLSYGIYLWHFPFVLLLRDGYKLPWWMTLMAATLFSFAMAAICFHLIDVPLKKWRRSANPLSATTT